MSTRAASAGRDRLLHFLDGDRRTGVSERTIQPTNGPHWDDPHRVVQNSGPQLCAHLISREIRGARLVLHGKFVYAE